MPATARRRIVKRGPCAELNNAGIAELLIREAEGASGHRAQAFRKAADLAFMWPVEARELRASDRSLTELDGVGPSIARRIHLWLDEPPSEVQPPEIRSEFLTRAAALELLRQSGGRFDGVKGDLQMHTTWSDGAGSVSEMAAAALERGYEYIAITDHTRGLKIANGLDGARLRKQSKEIAAANQQIARAGASFRVLRSAEMNLSPEGEGDMEPKSLQHLDLVLGCFHSALRRDEDQTERYLAAVRNPQIQILGHPQTRVYNRRVGLKADWARVFAEAAKLDKAIEIDGYADRQDLRVSLVRIAREEGVRISLGTDAHHPEQLAYMDLALGAACAADLPRDRILNFMSAAELLEWSRAVRESHR